MKKNKIILLIALIISITLIIILIINKNGPNKKDLSKISFKVYNSTECKIKNENFNVNGTSMEPLIKNNSQITLKLNYYNCNNNKPKSGDIIIFENPYSLEKVVKRLGVIPGDKIEINKKKGIIKLNGKTFVNSQNKEYTFNENELRWFEIYNKDGIIKDGMYFIFGDNINGSIDSRNYGPITLEGLLGKVDIK